MQANSSGSASKGAESEGSPGCWMPGTSVTLQGLASQPHLNGCTAKALDTKPDNGRLAVQLDVSGRNITVKQEN
eukprot:3924404-Karenia_brevis.AAC.1